MITGYKIWKTAYNGKDYWLLLVNRIEGDFMKRFDTKLEATDYFLKKVWKRR